MKKRTAKDIIDHLKDKKRQEDRANATFRFNSTLLSRFKGKCEKEGLSMTSVLEELMTDFLG